MPEDSRLHRGGMKGLPGKRIIAVVGKEIRRLWLQRVDHLSNALPSLASLDAALPASTGILTLSIIRICRFLLRERGHLERPVWRRTGTGDAIIGRPGEGTNGQEQR